MKKTAVCACVLSFLLLTAATAAQAQTESFKFGRGMFGMHCISHWQMFKFFRDLDLTAGQITELKDLKEQADNASTAILTQIADLHDEMDDTFLAAEIDNATAQAQIASMLNLQSQLSSLMLQAELQAVQILTADQRALILDLITQIRQCVETRLGWIGIFKPAYFSLLVPDRV